MSTNPDISVSYLDQELRKSRSLVTELRETLDKQAVALADQNQRLASMEERMTKLQAQLARVPAVEDAMQHTRDELVLRVNEVERGLQSTLNDQTKTRQAQREHDMQAIRDIQNELERFDSVEQSLTMRTAEEHRLSEQLLRMQETLTDVGKKVAAGEEKQRQLQEGISRTVQSIGQIQEVTHASGETDKNQTARLLLLETELPRLAERMKAYDGIRAEISRERDDLFETVRLNERARAQTLTEWGRKIESFGHQVDVWADQMRYYSDQHEKNRRVLQESQELIHGVSQQVDQVRQVQQIDSDQQRRQLDEARAQLERRLAQESDRFKTVETGLNKVLDQHDGRLDNLEAWRKQDVGTVDQLTVQVAALHSEAMSRVQELESVMLDLLKLRVAAVRQTLTDLEPRLKPGS